MKIANHSKHTKTLDQAKKLRRKFAEKMLNNPNNPKWEKRFKEMNIIVSQLKPDGECE